MVKIANQLHPPRPKNGREVELNKKCTIIKKDGTTTSVVGYGTQQACAIFVSSLRENAKKLNVQLKSNYVILKHVVK